jgi:hypothetical protein
MAVHRCIQHVSWFCTAHKSNLPFPKVHINAFLFFKKSENPVKKNFMKNAY